MKSFQSVKRKLKNKMMKKTAIFIDDDKPIELLDTETNRGTNSLARSNAITYQHFIDYIELDTKLPQVKVKMEHESLFSTNDKVSGMDTAYIKHQLFNKPPETIVETKEYGSTMPELFNKPVTETHVHTTKMQESYNREDTIDKFVLPSMTTNAISSDIFSLPEPDKDVLLVELQKTAEQAQYEAYIALQEGEKNLQALEQACDLINFFHTQLNQVKSQNQIKMDQTTSLLRSSLPSNIRQLEPNRIGMGLVNKPLLPSVRYSNSNNSSPVIKSLAGKNIEAEIEYQQNKAYKVHATLNGVLQSLGGTRNRSIPIKNGVDKAGGSVIVSRPDWEILGIYDTSSEAQIVCDNASSNDNKIYEKVQIRFDISNRKWITEGKITSQPLVTSPSRPKRGNSVPAKLTRRSLSNNSRISNNSIRSNHTSPVRPRMQRRSHSSSKLMKKSSYNQHSLRSTMYIIPENMKRTR